MTRAVTGAGISKRRGRGRDGDGDEDGMTNGNGEKTKDGNGVNGEKCQNSAPKNAQIHTKEPHFAKIDLLRC